MCGCPRIEFFIDFIYKYSPNESDIVKKIKIYSYTELDGKRKRNSILLQKLNYND